jgi:hypothetical protein
MLAATGGGPTASFYDGRNMIWVIAKNYPGSLWGRHWRKVIQAQLRITGEALRAWRGAAARAKLCGQLAGLLGLPKMLRKRQAIQSSRCISDADLLSSLL